MRATSIPGLPVATSWSRRAFLVAATAAIAAGSARADEGARPVILILSSDETERTLTTVAALKKSCDFAVRMSYVIGDEHDAGAFIADNIRDQQLALVAAVGPLATQVAVREFANTPVVYCEVPPDRPPVPSPLVHGVSMHLDPTLLLPRLQLLVPSIRNLGMILSTSSATYGSLVETAAANAGVSVVTRVAETSEDVTNAFVSLTGAAEAVWLPHEPRIWTASSLARVFHEATLQRYPLISFQRAHLDAPDAPALAAYTEPAGVGALTGRLIRSVLLQEAPPANDTVTPSFAGNARTMRAAGLPVSAKTAAALDELTGR